MNVSACRFGSPAFMTLPHFLHGDPQLGEMVTGLQPDPDAHSFYFAVEPVSMKLICKRFRFIVIVESGWWLAKYNVLCFRIVLETGSPVGCSCEIPAQLIFRTE